MEWRKIRNWLLLMLLAADLVLAGNLAWQLLRGRQAERQAVLDAVAVAAARGVELDGEEVLRLPAEMTGYSRQQMDSGPSLKRRSITEPAAATLWSRPPQTRCWAVRLCRRARAAA